MKVSHDMGLEVCCSHRLLLKLAHDLLLILFGVLFSVQYINHLLSIGLLID